MGLHAQPRALCSVPLFLSQPADLWRKDEHCLVLQKKKIKKLLDHVKVGTQLCFPKASEKRHASLPLN